MSKRGSAMLLLPKTITENMISAGTSVPVVDSACGEVAWSEQTPYTGVEVNINHKGRLYESIAESKGVEPGTDAKKWRETGPSNRMAPFDDKMSTKANAQGELIYVLKPGFFTGLALYGLEGEHLEITLRESAGGDVLYEQSGDMYEQAYGLFEYLFMPLRLITKRLSFGFELSADPELTIRITSNGTCAIGMSAIGFWESLLGESEVGGVEYGAEADIKTHSTITTNQDGVTTIVPRRSAVNISCTVDIDATQANRAAELLEQVAAKPVAIVLSDLPRYDYLNTFGLISGKVSPTRWQRASIKLTGRGYI